MRFPPVVSLPLLFAVNLGLGPVGLAQDTLLPDRADPVGALTSIHDSIRSLEKRIASLSSELAAPTLPNRESLELERKELATRRDSLQIDFDVVATGIDPGDYAPKPQEAFDLRRELEDLIRPIVDELKGLTERSREIEQLRAELSVWEARSRTARDGLTHLELLPAIEDAELKQELAETRSRWEERLQLADNRVKVITYQLEGAQKNRPSFYQATRDGIRDFFRTRGLNLFLCVLAFAVVFIALRLLHRRILRRVPWMRGASRPFYARLVDVCLYLLALVGSVSALLFVLYAAGDWVLLSLALVALIALALAARAGVPKFFNDAKTLLNLGEIREGERVVYEGIPWRIHSLSFFLTLKNDRLRGGTRRVPVRRLQGLLSRPVIDGELWFPTEEGDWVDLPERGRCRVVTQTTDWVQLVQLGGSRIAIPTLDFVAACPKNLSHGFRLATRFGIAYRHRKEAAEQIPGALEAHIHRGLAAILEDPSSVRSVRVEFAEAGPSSLDFSIVADFDGSVAARHDQLGRALQRLALEASNEQDWEIPYPRFTLQHEEKS